jgi:hypothetical protein
MMIELPKEINSTIKDITHKWVLLEPKTVGEWTHLTAARTSDLTGYARANGTGKTLDEAFHKLKDHIAATDYSEWLLVENLKGVNLND